MKQLIQLFRSEFDITIFDSPIALSVNDVEIIASEMDGVILAHSPRQCDKESVVEAKRLLQRANAKILGIVLSNISEKEQVYFYQQKHFRYEYHE
jgi:Mrp family chromosome partitioning ATPase